MGLIRGTLPAEFESVVNGYGDGDGYGYGSGYEIGRASCRERVSDTV